MLRKIVKLFKGVKLTAAVIALLILIYFLGLILPQKWMFDTRDLYELWKEKSIFNQFIDFIGFTEIYLSPVTIVLLALFFINLLTVTLYRIPVILKRAYLQGDMPNFSGPVLKGGKEVKILATDRAPSILAGELREFFKKKRWWFHEGKREHTYVAVKHRYSPIGFLFFHLSFFLCLIGGIVLTYTRFSGNLPLTEGQRFEGAMSQFRVISSDPNIMKQLPALSLHLEKVQPVYENEVPTELTAILTIQYEGELSKEIIRINEPVNRGAMSIIAESIGVSPLFIVRGPSGSQIDAAYVSLNVLGGEEDTFQFETDKRFTFAVRFYPDFVRDRGAAATKSIEMKNPAILLTAGKDGKVIYQGVIKLGEYADLGVYSIGFEDVRYWVEFLIIREYGKIPLIAGFILAAIGLIMRLVFFQKRLRIAIEEGKEGTVLYMDGKSEFFQYSFQEELNALADGVEVYIEKSKHDERE